MPPLAPEKPKFLAKERPKSGLQQPGRQSNSLSIISGVLILLLIVAGVSRMFLSHSTVKPDSRLRVVAAAQDIMPGTLIAYNHIRYMDIPREYADEGLFARTNLVIGHVTRQFVPARNPIHKDFLYPKGKGLSNILETHERAITLKLSDEGLVDHQLFPGDKVDVLVTMVDKGRHYTRTICQNVRVVSAVTRSMLESRNFRGDRKSHVTLAVTPDVAELLAEAEHAGEMKLLLRNRLATVNSHLPGVSEADLLPDKAGMNDNTAATAGRPASELAAVQVPEPPPMEGLPTEPDEPLTQAPPPPGMKWIVEMFSGSSRTSYAVPGPGQ